MYKLSAKLFKQENENTSKQEEGSKGKKCGSSNGEANIMRNSMESNNNLCYLCVLEVELDLR